MFVKEIKVDFNVLKNYKYHQLLKVTNNFETVDNMDSHDSFTNYLGWRFYFKSKNSFGFYISIKRLPNFIMN